MTTLTTRGERLKLFASNALHCDRPLAMADTFGRLDRQKVNLEQPPSNEVTCVTAAENCALEPLEHAKTSGSADHLKGKVSNYRGDEPPATFPLTSPSAG